MKASYAVNSKGEVINTESLANIFKVRGMQNRISEIDAFIADFAFFMSRNGYTVNENSFIYKIQPYYTEDRIYMFVKTPLEANSRLVKRANGIIFPNEKEDDEAVLKSITSTPEREKTVWYILQVFEIILERNTFDCEWESFTISKPALFSAFISWARKNELSPEDLKLKMINKGFIYPQEKKVPPIQEIIKDAVPLLGAETPAENAEHIREVFYKYIEQVGYSAKKDYANQAIQCLYIINDLSYEGNIYNVYETIKPLLKSLLPNSKYVRYQSGNNTISYDYQNNHYVIYVRSAKGKQDQYTLVINGKIYNNIKEMTSDVQGLIKPCKWYEEIVVPNIK